MENKCMSCTERHENCHSNCTAYKKYKQELEQVRKAWKHRQKHYYKLDELGLI